MRDTTRVKDTERPFLWSVTGAAAHADLRRYWERECELQSTIDHPRIAKLLVAPDTTQADTPSAEFSCRLEGQPAPSLSPVAFHLVAIHVLDAMQAYADAGAPPPILALSGIQRTPRGLVLTTSGTYAFGVTRLPLDAFAGNDVAVAELRALRALLAPELRTGEQPATIEASVYSYGALLKSLSPLTTPTTTSSAATTTARISEYALSKHQSLYSLVVEPCLVEDPAARPTIKELRARLTTEETPLRDTLSGFSHQTTDGDWFAQLALEGLRTTTAEQLSFCAQILGETITIHKNDRPGRDRIIFDMGGVEALLGVMAEYQANSSVVGGCCHAMVNVCSQAAGAGAERLVELGVISGLMAAMTAHQDTAFVVQHAAWALSNLSHGQDKIVTQITEEHLLTLIAVAQRSMDKPHALNQLLSLLHRLVSETVVFQSVARSAPALSACTAMVAEAISRHAPENAFLATRAVELQWALYMGGRRNPDGIALMVEAGVLEALCSAVQFIRAPLQRMDTPGFLLHDLMTRIELDHAVVRRRLIVCGGTDALLKALLQELSEHAAASLRLALDVTHDDA